MGRNELVHRYVKEFSQRLSLEEYYITVEWNNRKGLDDFVGWPGDEPYEHRAATFVNTTTHTAIIMFNDDVDWENQQGDDTLSFITAHEMAHVFTAGTGLDDILHQTHLRLYEVGDLVSVHMERVYSSVEELCSRIAKLII